MLTHKHIYSNSNAEDHPVFKEELARIEEDRAKKLGQAKHMLDLGCSNEEATFDIEQRTANNTLEVRKSIFFLHSWRGGFGHLGTHTYPLLLTLHSFARMSCGTA